jgi:hypothetical protein
MAFLTAEQKKEQGLIRAGFDHSWMIRRELKNGEVARVVPDDACRTSAFSDLQESACGKFTVSEDR